MSEIICGDALSALRDLPDGIVQTCVTSPPYFGLRDYNVEGQIGLEDTPEAYIARLVEVFREVKRVLRPDGTLWLNCGDSYGDGKQLQMIPARLALALQADGWILRADLIWHKPNCMPESVTDRPTKAHEYIFLLSKSERYYYDADAIREPNVTDSNIRNRAIETWGKNAYPSHLAPMTEGLREWNNPAGRNKRSVWTVSTMPYSEAHFATFPPKLIEPCILAGTSVRACEQCGAPWERVTEREFVPTQNPLYTKGGIKGMDKSNGWGATPRGITNTTTLDWQPTCTCDNTGSGACVVLDPFCGAGTVPLVALKYQRQYIGIELNPSYVELINKRIHTTQPVLWEVGA